MVSSTLRGALVWRSNCSMRASMNPTRSWSGALIRPAIAFSGATMAPSTCPRSTSAGGSDARSRTWSALIGLPCKIPPRTLRIFVWRAVSESAFATPTMSPSPTKAMAVGPSRSSMSSGRPASSAARFVSVFFTTVKRAPCFSTSVRTPSISGIDSPR